MLNRTPAIVAEFLFATPWALGGIPTNYLAGPGSSAPPEGSLGF